MGGCDKRGWQNDVKWPKKKAFGQNFDFFDFWAEIIKWGVYNLPRVNDNFEKHNPLPTPIQLGTLEYVCIRKTKFLCSQTITY